MRTFTIPPGRRGDPFLPAIDDPAVAVKFGKSTHAFAGRRRSGVGGASRFAGAEAGQRRSAFLQERSKHPATLLRRAAQQDRQKTKHRSEHRQGDARIHAVKFLGHDGHVGQAGVLATRRLRNAFLKKPPTTMASYTGLVARNRSSAVGSNSAALAPASTSVANRRDSSWSSRCCGVSVKSMAMETFLNLIGHVCSVIRYRIGAGKSRMLAPDFLAYGALGRDSRGSSGA